MAEICKCRLRGLDDVFTKNVQEVFFCGYYSDIARSDGIHNAHYPKCEDKNCPLKHPELLIPWTSNWLSRSS